MNISQTQLESAQQIIKQSKLARNEIIHNSQFKLEIIDTILFEIRQEQIKIDEIKFFLSKQGLPVECDLQRPYIWNLILGNISQNRNEWQQDIELQKVQYDSLMDLYFKNELKNQLPLSENQNINDLNYKIQKDFKDHPLSKTESSSWNTYFNDNKIWKEIEKDTLRTRKDYFHQYYENKQNYPNMSQSQQSVQQKEYKYTILTRILFIFAKMNPKINYIQGMNEILAVLFFGLQSFEEPVIYFCFQKIMDQFQDNFILDQPQKIIKKFSDILKKVDFKLWDHLRSQNVQPEFYLLKWNLLLFSQDFSLRDVCILWDVILSHQDKQNFVYFVSVGVLICARQNIINGDFAYIMQLLKNISQLDIQKIIIIAQNTYSQIYQQNKILLS